MSRRTQKGILWGNMIWMTRREEGLWKLEYRRRRNSRLHYSQLHMSTGLGRNYLVFRLIPWIRDEVNWNELGLGWLSDLRIDIWCHLRMKRVRSRRVWVVRRDVILACDLIRIKGIRYLTLIRLARATLCT